MYVFYVMDVNVIYTSNNKNRNKLPNAIAFDLDETIGSFSDFHSIWARLDDYMKTQVLFDEIMDMYPEFLRIGILSVLRYIKCKQDVGVCLPIYIYTNNQCEDVKWVYQLIEYLESRVFPGKKATMFARPIFAFKINGNRVEENRTTHDKTYSDFIKCSMLSNLYELCFIDDVYYSKMKHKRVYYIQPPPYVHTISYKEVIDRFISSDIYKKLYPDRSISNISLVSYSNDDLNIQEEQKITNKIMYHIREFFLISSRKRLTKKRQHKIGNFTRKKKIM